MEEDDMFGSFLVELPSDKTNVICPALLGYRFGGTVDIPKSENIAPRQSECQQNQL